MTGTKLRRGFGKKDFHNSDFHVWTSRHFDTGLHLNDSLSYYYRNGIPILWVEIEKEKVGTSLMLV